MTTGEAPDSGDERAGRGGHGERIGVGGGDDSVTRIQLAARWAEAYAAPTDSLAQVLKRFRAAFDYLDAVIHGVEPNDLDHELTSTMVPAPRAASAPVQPPTAEQPAEL